MNDSKQVEKVVMARNTMTIEMKKFGTEAEKLRVDA